MILFHDLQLDRLYLIYITNFPSKSLQLGINLDATGTQESVLTHCQAALFWAEITHSCSSVEPVQLQLGILTEVAEELLVLQHKPSILNHDITNSRPIELIEYIATVFSNPSQNQFSKTHEKDSMKPMIS